MLATAVRYSWVIFQALEVNDASFGKKSIDLGYRRENRQVRFRNESGTAGEVMQYDFFTFQTSVNKKNSSRNTL
jgi:hypothetical protein